MKLEEYRPLVEALLPAVLAAGRIEMAHFAAGVEVETKADTTPVTIADHEAEEVLTEGLHRAAPGIPVIAEEAVAAGRVPATGDAFFLVDPLDGTRAFIKGSPEFTINIGLVVDAQAGVRHHLRAGTGPILRNRWPGRVDRGENPDRGHRDSIFADSVTTRLATREPDPQALVAFASRSHASQTTDEFLQRLPIAEKRKASSSLKFCLIARGEADLYARLGQTSEWDTAAGQAILAAAGGSVDDARRATADLRQARRRLRQPAFHRLGAAAACSAPPQRRGCRNKVTVGLPERPHFRTT